MTIAEIYARIPDAQCVGLCARACGPIAMSRRELVTLRAAAGRRLRAAPFGDGSVALEVAADGQCVLLRRGRCAAYGARPLICRMFGAVEGLECPFGCRPAAGLLPRREAAELIRAAKEIRL